MNHNGLFLILQSPGHETDRDRLADKERDRERKERKRQSAKGTALVRICIFTTVALHLKLCFELLQGYPFPP